MTSALDLFYTTGPVEERADERGPEPLPVRVKSLSPEWVSEGGAVEVVDGPAVVVQPDRPSAGIRVVTAFRGMFAVRDQLMDELYAWADQRAITYGHTFFRLHVVDMGGPVDLEVGVLTGEAVEGDSEAVEGDSRVRAGVLPGGRYATLTYVNHGRRANGMLRDWAQEQGLELDRTDSPEGERFGCRYEAYLTDPRSERMKTRWRIELAIRLADLPS